MSASRGVVAAAVVAAVMASLPAAAFEVWGLASGMSRQQVLAQAARAGWSARPFGDEIVLLPPQARGSAIRAGFCGRALVRVERDFENDLQYDAALRRLWSRLGPPREFDMVGDMGVEAYAGRFDGEFRSAVALDWHIGPERVRLTSALGWRRGMNALARDRPPSIAYETWSPCVRE